MRWERAFTLQLLSWLVLFDNYSAFCYACLYVVLSISHRNGVFFVPAGKLIVCHCSVTASRRTACYRKVFVLKYFLDFVTLAYHVLDDSLAEDNANSLYISPRVYRSFSYTV